MTKQPKGKGPTAEQRETSKAELGARATIVYTITHRTVGSICQVLQWNSRQSCLSAVVGSVSRRRSVSGDFSPPPPLRLDVRDPAVGQVSQRVLFCCCCWSGICTNLLSPLFHPAPPWNWMSETRLWDKSVRECYFVVAVGLEYVPTCSVLCSILPHPDTGRPRPSCGTSQSENFICLLVWNMYQTLRNSLFHPAPPCDWMSETQLWDKSVREFHLCCWSGICINCCLIP